MYSRYKLRYLFNFLQIEDNVSILWEPSRQERQQYRRKLLTLWGQSESTMGRGFVLHAIALGLITSAPRLLGVIPEQSQK